MLFAKKVSDRLLYVMHGFSAGVMLAATSFSFDCSRDGFGRSMDCSNRENIRYLGLAFD